MAKVYWIEEQEILCKIISTGSTVHRDAAFTKMYPIFNKMIDIIIKRYFSGNRTIFDKEFNQDVHSACMVKIFNGLTNNYDGKAKAFSYVQTIIKNVCHDLITRNPHSNRIKTVDLQDVDVISHYDNVIYNSTTTKSDMLEYKRTLIKRFNDCLSKCDSKRVNDKKRIKIFKLLIDIFEYPFDDILTKESISLICKLETNTSIHTIQHLVYSVDRPLGSLFSKLEKREEFKKGKLDKVLFDCSNGMLIPDMDWNDINNAFNVYYDNYRKELIEKYGFIPKEKSERKYITEEELKERYKEIS